MSSRKTTEALELFHNGFNCAQAVLSAYAPTNASDWEQAMKLAAGFGGGMGRMQKTCGAATGAFMSIGIINSLKYLETAAIKEACNTMIQKFCNKFTHQLGSMECRDLLNCDLNTEAGKQHYEENQLKNNVCEKCIVLAIDLLEELTSNQSE
jgi:C_GCAxxG_C_C family probable redox protein